MLGVFAFVTPSLQSCNDEPDGDNFYTFTGQMMSEYLTKNAEYSQYAKIVQRAGLMDQLSAYGHYTCFVPNNAAVDAYLAAKGKTIDDLTDAECDTIARTHLVNVMYSVTEMGGGTASILPTQNMMRRNLQISRDVDENGNSVVVVNGGSVVYFEHQDDSVENGIMQPVSAVIVNSTSTTASLISKNPNVSLYAQALALTGLADSLERLRDPSYNPEDYPEDIEYITGADIHEVACRPDDKLYGYTAFLVPDEVLKAKYGITTIQELYNYACNIYDTMYPEDVSKPEHDFEHLNSTVNPLYRFMAYHLLDRNVQGYNFLNVREDRGVVKDLVNTTDWYTTMLPYTMVKVERLNVRTWLGRSGILGESYINRCYNDQEFIEGVHVRPSVDGYTNDGPNGVYFYVDDILKFDEEVRDRVHNTRIRMDFSTIFPEIMTQNMRMNGTYKDDNNSGGKYDHTYKEGRNFYFPPGYLKGVKFTDMKNNYNFIYRRPRLGYYSMHGDEMIAARSIFDLTFLVPPVPFEGEWQIRLGFAPMNQAQDNASRGVCQIYFGEEGNIKAQDIPLNMEKRGNDPSVYGTSRFVTDKSEYEEMRQDPEKRAEDFKILKNKGYYRGPFSIYHNGDVSATDGTRFAVQTHTVRKVLCTVKMKPGVNYYLRIRNVSSWRPADKEGMFDYLELVPKSVFGITDGENAEDDL